MGEAYIIILIFWAVWRHPTIFLFRHLNAINQWFGSALIGSGSELCFSLHLHLWIRIHGPKWMRIYRNRIHITVLNFMSLNTDRQIKKLTETAALYKKKNTAQPFPTGKCFDSLIWQSVPFLPEKRWDFFIEIFWLELDLKRGLFHRYIGLFGQVCK